MCDDTARVQSWQTAASVTMTGWICYCLVHWQLPAVQKQEILTPWSHRSVRLLSKLSYEMQTTKWQRSKGNSNGSPKQQSEEHRKSGLSLLNRTKWSQTEIVDVNDVIYFCIHFQRKHAEDKVQNPHLFPEQAQLQEGLTGKQTSRGGKHINAPKLQ